ncbi:helix-turn-helix transcriptional regulator [Planctomicrobium sp. SH664]|uniref:helix-turn-helix transcriptional regulator n=1 Tax=Planctomicrobium sp. SH664 TaxID=3448125 RepID=UPI003F5C2719
MPAILASIKLDTLQAAEYIGVSPGTLRTWRCQSRGPQFIKIGAKVLYLKSHIDGWLASRTVECNDAPLK